MLLHLYVSTFLLLFVTAAKADRDEQVQTAIEALESIKVAPYSGFRYLDSIGKGLEKLVKAMVPIGELASSLSNSTELNEEGVLTLMDFKNKSIHTRKIMEQARKLYTDGYSASIERPSYKANVDDRIDYMMKLINQYLDPEVEKDEQFVQDFVEACSSGENSPQTILEHMFNRLVVKCGNSLSQKDVNIMAGQRRYLREVFGRFRVYNWGHTTSMPDFESYLPEFLQIYHRIDQEVFQQEFHAFKVSFNAYETAIRDYLDDLKHKTGITVESNEFDCLPRALLTLNNFNYQMVDAFATLLKSHLIDLSFISGVCAGLPSSGNETDININITDINNLISTISSSTFTWLNESLTSAWPSAHDVFLKKHVGDDYSKIGTSKLVEAMTRLARNHPDQIGIPDYNYEIVIMKDEGKEFYFEEINNYCSLIRDGGLTKMLGRITTNPSLISGDDLSHRMASLSKYAVELDKLLQSELQDIYDLPTLAMVAKSLKKRIGKTIISEEDFHCWAIVRQDTSRYHQDGNIQYLSAPYAKVDLKSISTVTYNNKGSMFRKPNRLLFIFFA